MQGFSPQPAPWRAQSLGLFARLPDELVSYLLGYADVPSLCRLSCSSKVMRVFCLEEPLWKLMCLRYHRGLLEYKGNWRRTGLIIYGSAPQDAIDAALQPLAPVPGLESLFLNKRWIRCHMQLSNFLPMERGIIRQPLEGLTPDDVLMKYDRPGSPLLLQGTFDQDEAEHWSLDALCQRFGGRVVGVSKPVTGKIPMKLSEYVSYVQLQHDEEPLYIFDEYFGERIPELLDMYSVPPVFHQDYLGLLGATKRPPYRWMVIGPSRSGAAWHIDPSQTSAWNTLISGSKRWALFPPGHIPPGVQLRVSGSDIDTSDQLSALQWFLEVYPCLSPCQLPSVEFVQRPGETVFVPGGWWHIVLNLEDSVAVTQNFVSDANLERVLHHTAVGGLKYMRASGQLPATLCLEDDMDESGSESDPDEADAMGVESGQAVHQQTAGSCSSTSEECAVDAQITRLPGLHVDVKYLRVRVKGRMQKIMQQVLNTEGPARSRTLGRWIHLLWHAAPHHRPTLQSCAESFLSSACWQQLLGVISHQLNIPAPSSPLELVPLVSSAGLVFLGPNHVFKLLAHPVQPKAHLMGWLEAHLCSAVLSSLPSLGVLSPQPLAVGHIHWTPDKPLQQSSLNTPTILTQNGVTSPQEPGRCSQVFEEGPPTGLPFIVLSRVAGRHTTDPFPTLLAQSRESVRQSVLRQLGEWTARLHSLPLPTSAVLIPPAPAHAGDERTVEAPGCSSNATVSNGTSPPDLEIAVGAKNGRQCIIHAASSSSTCGCADGPDSVLQTWRQGQRCDGLGPELFSAASALFQKGGVGWQDWQGLVWSCDDAGGLVVASGVQDEVAPFSEDADEVMTAGDRENHQQIQKESGVATHAPNTAANSGPHATPASASHAGEEAPCNQPGTDQNGEARVGLQQGEPPHTRSLRADALKSSEGHIIPDHDIPALWRPFVAFLRCRREAVLQEMKEVAEEGAMLPTWVTSQVEDFLPNDAAQLVLHCGRCAVACQSSQPAPCWLHTDLSGHNLLLGNLSGSTDMRQPQLESTSDVIMPGMQNACSTSTFDDAPGSIVGKEQPQQQVAVVDFADSGMGDPLFELVALQGSAFNFNAEWLKFFVMGYRDAAPDLYHKFWIKRAGLKPSYVAMCYLLLHEEGIVDMFLKFPHWTKYCSLEDMQHGLWSVLDEIAMHNSRT